MKKNIISCMAIMVAALASACGDYQVNHECEIGDVKSENDSVIYRCVGIKDKYSYWEKEICQYGILEDKDEKGTIIGYVCKECDPQNEIVNKCEIKVGEAKFSVCDNGIWKSSSCVSGECSADGKTCGCSKCVKGCDGNANGACINVDGCKQNNPETGACICINGNNADGTCKCDKCVAGCEADGACTPIKGCKQNNPETGACICINGNNDDGTCKCENCVAGCEADGACKMVEGCDWHDQTGACVCAHGNKEDGSCNDSYCTEGTFNPKDGSCTCPKDCIAGCFENGVCKIIGNCLEDADCNEYGYCSGNMCYCDNNKCKVNDANGNHMYDYLEPSIENKSCDSDKDCNVSGGEFCDNAMGYKCSVKCGKDDDCVEGFMCRKSDGRCVSKYFTTVWDKEIRNKKIEIHVSECSNIDVYWDWKDDEANIPEHIDKCSSVLTHDYSKTSSPDDDSNVIVKIQGELNGVNFFSDLYSKNGCALGCSLLEVRSFGVAGFALRKIGEDERGAFEQCYKLEKLSEVDIPEPKKLTSMRKMFTNACSLNSPLEHWDVSNVTDMQKTFWMPNCAPDAIGETQCFNISPTFNQPLNRWNVSKVTNMNCMFQHLRGFNQPLNKWNVSNVTDMGGMFAHAVSFNQPLDQWTITRVTHMGSMFYRAFSFDQDLSGWNPKGVDINKKDTFLGYTGSYSAQYIIGVYRMLWDSGIIDEYNNNNKGGNTYDKNWCKIVRSNNWSKLIDSLWHSTMQCDNPDV